MSFLGALGQLIGGIGLQEWLEVIYAVTAASDISTGKAINFMGYLRAHFERDITVCDCPV